MPNFQLKTRKGTDAELTSFGALEGGEFAFTTDKKQVWIGDGAANYLVGGGSVTDNLNDLGDVTITSVADDEFLQYHAGSGLWINQTYAEAKLLYPVTITAVGDNEVVQYDDGTSLWINRTLAEANIAAADEVLLKDGSVALTADWDSGAYTITSAEFDGDKYVLTASTELTIATGAVTATRSWHRIDTEADAASDDLDTINGGEAGMLLFIRAENTARSVVVKDGTGNITLPGGDVTLDDTERILLFLYDSVVSKWILAGGAETGAGGGTASACAVVGEIPGVEVGEKAWIQVQMDANRDFSAPTVDAEGKDAQTYWYYSDGTDWTAYPAAGVSAAMSEQQNDHGDYETSPVSGEYAGYEWMYEVPAATLTKGTLYYRRFRPWDGIEYGNWQMLEPVIAQ